MEPHPGAGAEKDNSPHLNVISCLKKHLAALQENPGSVLMTHMIASDYLYLLLQRIW